MPTGGDTLATRSQRLASATAANGSDSMPKVKTPRPDIGKPPAAGRRAGAGRRPAQSGRRPTWPEPRALLCSSPCCRGWASGNSKRADGPGAAIRLPRKLPVEFPMGADPNPEPGIVLPQGDRPIVQRHPHRPGSRIGRQSFQAKSRMSGILQENSVGLSRGGLCFRRQLVIEPPESVCSPRNHGRQSKSPSSTTGNTPGLR